MTRLGGKKMSIDLDRFLTPHFVLREFVRSATAIGRRIDNTPPPHVVDALQLLCERVLEPIREHFGCLTITSGYRCEALNLLVRGVSTSDHMLGRVADIELPHVGNDELGDWIDKNIIDFDQLIYEFTDPPRASNEPKDPHAGWIHVGYTNGRNRRLVLRKN